MVAAYFVPPRFTAVSVGGDLEVTDLRTRSVISLGGELAQDFVHRPGRAAERLSGLAKLDPSLHPLSEALARSTPAPYNRATLLEGSGYDRLFVELTSRCNERCAHCYAESSPERSETLPRHVVFDVIDAAARLGFRSVQLTGGDPLIAPCVLDAAEHATRSESFEMVEIYTNGLALKGELFERLAALSVAFAFSFYSHRPEAHDAMTGTPGSQVRTLDAIRASVAANLRTRVSIIVNDDTTADVDDTVALLTRAGVSREAIAVDGVRAVGRGTDGHVALPETLSTRHDGTSGPPQLEFAGTLAVLASGSVVPCIFQREAILGNVLDASLDAIARSPVPLPLPTTTSPDQEAECATRLGCVECRLRNHLLAPQPLLKLGRRAS